MWLEENTPCKATFAIEEIAKFLPHSTRHGSKSMDRMRIVRTAIRRACGTFDIGGDLPKVEKKKKTSSPSTISRMIDEIQKNGPAKPIDFVNVEFAHARLSNFLKKGAINRSNGIYFVGGQDVSTYQKRPRTIEVNDERF